MLALSAGLLLTARSIASAGMLENKATAARVVYKQNSKVPCFLSLRCAKPSAVTVYNASNAYSDPSSLLRVLGIPIEVSFFYRFFLLTKGRKGWGCCALRSYIGHMSGFAAKTGTGSMAPIVAGKPKTLFAARQLAELPETPLRFGILGAANIAPEGG